MQYLLSAGKTSEILALTRNRESVNLKVGMPAKSKDS